MERKIASLSGSTAASDVATRRKLQAELNEAKANLDDEYISHSRSAQDAALDAEQEAYTLSKEKYIEQLEEQLKDTETLIENSIMDVLFNADTVYTELNNLADLYGIDLSDSLTQPWKKASAQAIEWKEELARTLSASELALITHESGAVTAFSNGVATKIEGTWSRVQTAARNYAGYLTSSELSNGFSRTLTGFGSQIQAIADKWNAVKRAADDAYAAQTRKVTVGGNVNYSSGGGTGSSGGSGGSSGSGDGSKKTPETAKTMHASGQLFVRTVVPTNIVATHKTVGGVTYVPIPGTDYYVKKTDAPFGSAPYGTTKYKYYAKGTTGVLEDQLAIVDELGPELILRANPKTGRLDYLTKGTSVIPAEATTELMKLADIGVDGLTMPQFDSGVNVLTNYISKPELNIDIAEFVHVDKVDKDTMPQLEAMVDKKINDFSRQLNYALKRYTK